MRKISRGNPTGGRQRLQGIKTEPLLSFDAERELAWGYETQSEPEDYHWKGKGRGSPSELPRVLFQFTLAGRGEYEEGGLKTALLPGQSFLVLLPSDHSYYLPADSPRWSFFWFILRHPFVVERIRQLRRTEPAVHLWAKDSALIRASLHLVEEAAHGRLRDVWAYESLLFAWLLQLEKSLHRNRYPENQRQRVLEENRRHVLAALPRPMGAADLARVQRQERTVFSRRFKTATGLSPGAFATEVRLEEAIKLLRTEAKLEEVASKTGFADANHFCKVFRRHFQTTPGFYRKNILRR